MPKKKAKLSLSKTHPKLAKETDGWDATLFTAGSGRPMKWKCKVGHTWIAKIQNRAGDDKNGCPYCGNKKILPGFNDLKTKFPAIAAEADGWDPLKIHPGTHTKFSWICKLGHRYQNSPSQRTNRGTGCPYCSGKKVLKGFNDLLTTHPNVAKQANGWDPTTISAGVKGKFSWKCSENHIWNASVPNRALKKSGCPFCIGRKVEKGFNDLKSTHPLLSNEAVDWNPETLSKGSHTKVKWACKFGHTWFASPNSRTSKNSGCPVCAGISVIPGINDLETTHPEIALEANGWDPSLYYHGSEKKLEWVCVSGHKFKSSLKHRSVRGQGCPYCSGNKVLKGFNDLKTRFPDIAAESFGWDPATVLSGSGKKYKWKCNCGHTWKTSVSLRTSAFTGCPSCAKSGFDPNINSWIYFLKHNEWRMYQIGITNDLKRRLSEHSLNGWEFAESRGPIDGHLAQQWETAILRMLKAKGADLSNSNIAGKFDGYSESWSKSTLQVKSIKELMRLTEEFEEN